MDSSIPLGELAWMDDDDAMPGGQMGGGGGGMAMSEMQTQMQAIQLHSNKMEVIRDPN